MTKMKPALAKTIPILIALSFAACSNKQPQNSSSSNTVTLDIQWTLSGLDSPESVILSEGGDFYYVSNVGGKAADKDNNGYISKISLEGEIIVQKWAVGLNAPKGLALDGGKLYVSDIDRLVSIDTESGEINGTYPADGAGFLNDVASTSAGVLTADSATSRIFKLEGNVMTEFANDERLSGVNGLLQDGQRLLITTMDAGELLTLDMESRTLTAIASGMKNADGIAVLSSGNYLTSAWPGQIFHVRKDGAITVILDTQDATIFQNDILLNRNTLIAPNWQPGTLTAYKVE